MSNITSHVIEDDEETVKLDAIEMSRLLGITLDEYLSQCENQKKSEEFWSDSCWSE